MKNVFDGNKLHTANKAQFSIGLLHLYFSNFTIFNFMIEF